MEYDHVEKVTLTIKKAKYFGYVSKATLTIEYFDHVNKTTLTIRSNKTQRYASASLSWIYFYKPQCYSPPSVCLQAGI
jgi:hypothetical protein